MIDVIKLTEALQKHGSKRGAVVELGYAYTNSTALKKVNDAIKTYGLDYLLCYKKNGRRDTDWSESNLRILVSESNTFSGVLRKIGVGTRGRNITDLRNKLDAAGIDYTHFDRYHTHYKPVDEVFIVSKDISHQVVKRRFLKLVEYKCKECSLSQWLDKEIRLELDHINGINYDHRLENLRLLCPNCHSQTETFCIGHIKIP